MGRIRDDERRSAVLAELHRIANEEPPLLGPAASIRVVSDEEIDHIRRGVNGRAILAMLWMSAALLLVMWTGVAITAIGRHGIVTGGLITLGAGCVAAPSCLLLAAPFRRSRRLANELLDGLGRPVTAEPVLFGLWATGWRPGARGNTLYVTLLVDLATTSFCTMPVLTDSLRATGWSYQQWWAEGSDYGWLVGGIQPGAPVALIDRHGRSMVSRAGPIEVFELSGR